MTMAGVAALLPEELGQLTELRYLDFSGNGISGIPPFCFAKMNKLESLRLEGNALATFAIDLSGLSSLRELDLSHNVLNQIPPEVASLKQLSSLNLEGNSIPELPAQLSTLPLLTKLQVGPQNGCMRCDIHRTILARLLLHPSCTGRRHKRLSHSAPTASWPIYPSCSMANNPVIA